MEKAIRTKNRQLDHIQNKITDLRHKLSRRLISMLLERGVDTAAIGELKGIGDHASYGSWCRQKTSLGQSV